MVSVESASNTGELARRTATTADTDMAQLVLDTGESELDTTESVLDTAESVLDTAALELDTAELELVTAESELDTVELELDTAESELDMLDTVTVDLTVCRNPFINKAMYINDQQLECNIQRKTCLLFFYSFVREIKW